MRSTHYHLISANVASLRWAEGRKNDVQWTTLRRLGDGGTNAKQRR